jgi:Na+/H+ antiporter NhaD/arsenite permease-like protein
MTAAILVFAAAYLCMAGRPLPFLHIDRPAAALIGAVAMVAAGVLTIDEAFAAIDLQVLALLLGVMVIASYLAEAKFFRYTAWLVMTRMRSARSLLWSVVFVVGGLSALLVNDTVCLMLTPLLVAVVAEAELPPLPYLLAWPPPPTWAARSPSPAIRRTCSSVTRRPAIPATRTSSCSRCRPARSASRSTRPC